MKKLPKLEGQTVKQVFYRTSTQQAYDLGEDLALAGYIVTYKNDGNVIRVEATECKK